MSDVYEALDVRTGISVAIKIVRSGDPEFVQRLSHEARALESFQHPGLVQLFDTGLAAIRRTSSWSTLTGSAGQLLRRGPSRPPKRRPLGRRSLTRSRTCTSVESCTAT